jgi:hypothetical protein
MTFRTSTRALGGAFVILATAGATLTLSVPAAAALQLGGWRSADTGDSGVQAAAAYAAGEVGGSLASVDSAQTQSAAGTNYRLTISLEDGAVWAVTVHRDLQGGFSMLSSSQTRAPSGGGAEEPDTGSNQAPDDTPESGSSDSSDDTPDEPSGDSDDDPNRR